MDNVSWSNRFCGKMGFVTQMGSLVAKPERLLAPETHNQLKKGISPTEMVASKEM